MVCTIISITGHKRSRMERVLLLYYSIDYSHLFKRKKVVMNLYLPPALMMKYHYVKDEKAS